MSFAIPHLSAKGQVSSQQRGAKTMRVKKSSANRNHVPVLASRGEVITLKRVQKLLNQEAI
jgi:hypothetical protein